MGGTFTGDFARGDFAQEQDTRSLARCRTDQRLERVPFEFAARIGPALEIGPVTDLAVVNETYVQLGELVDGQIENVPSAEDFARDEGIRVHWDACRRRLAGRLVLLG
jgi:hypothetical protein